MTLFFLLLSVLNSFAEDRIAIHPIPTEPTLISKTLTEVLTKELPPPPLAGTLKQKKDEQVQMDYQKTRLKEDCLRAENEVQINLQNFFGEPLGPLNKEEVAKYSPLFVKVKNDADYYIQILKKVYPRKRPFLYMKGIEACVPKETTLSYPSGHTALAHLFSDILVGLFPDKKQKILNRANQIANDRVLSGMHHLSDVEAGRDLGHRLYNEFKNSKEFNQELAKK